MRAFIFSVALAAVTTSALADSADYYEPQASLYMSFSFDSPPPKLNAPKIAALRYGFQLERQGQTLFQNQQAGQAPLLRWEFSNLKFDNLSVSGTPLINRQMILQADGEGGAINFVKDNAALLAFGLGGAILAFAIVDGDKDSRNRDPADPDGPGTQGTSTIDNSSPRDADGLPGSNESENAPADSGPGGNLPDLAGMGDGMGDMGGAPTLPDLGLGL